MGTGAQANSGIIARMTPNGLAPIAAASLAPGETAFGPAMPDHRVHPGVGAGGVRLGMSEGQVLRVLGRPDERHMVQGATGRLVHLLWTGIAVTRWAGAGGRVVGIAITDRGIRLEDGTGVGTPRMQVRRRFPRALTDPSCDALTIAGDGAGTPITTLAFGPGGRVAELRIGREIA